ncbi:MAG: thioredoxin domain-containing protein [Acidobacteria bacterium]|nr:MAG: thioredoxin domain-containing protein [Acidobacteriota bacterium]
MTKAPPANRLIGESSPYLRQHAHNPVAWYPWGEEALARARDEDKPIFLSIGYAACHWCHVMERESFEDPAIAGLLAAHFVAIKVDREERPDLDAVYMSAVQAMTGAGGWPLSVFLTPGLQPFFGGTYFPPERAWGMPSFREVLAEVADAWQGRREQLEGVAATLAAQLAADEEPAPGSVDAVAAAADAMRTLTRQADRRWGGFGAAPKFPTPSRLFFLIARARRDPAARELLTATLDGMAAGGFYDWLGGGFHRYSVDEAWRVPHFEKMLYDNALLARAYGEAGLVCDRPEWVAVARATADYLLAEMRGPEGAFFSSTDADSEGQEGRYFTWTAAQVRAALPAEEAELVTAVCGLESDGGPDDEAQVLRPSRPLAEAAAELGLRPGEAAGRLAAARERLLAARRRRVPPATDDKRLTGWNGMAAWSLAYLGAALPEPRYVAAADTAGRFLLARIARDGRLQRSWREGAVSGVETLEDVAWVVAAFVQLFEAGGGAAWLEAAGSLVRGRLPHYQRPAGALDDAPDDGPPLPARPRAPADGATPAPAGVMAGALLRLAALTGEEGLRAAAARAVAADAALVTRAPEACLTLVQAATAAAAPPSTLVVVGDPRWTSTRALVAAAWRHKPARCVLAPATSVPVTPEAARVVPLFAGRETAPSGRARAYLCEGGACRLPLEEEAALARLLSATGD